MDNDIKLLKKVAGEFAAKELSPVCIEAENDPASPGFIAAATKAWELGFFTVAFPAIGQDAHNPIQSLCAVTEAIAERDASMAALILVHSLAGQMMLEAGHLGLLEEISRASDIPFLACCAYTNPEEKENKLYSRQQGNSFMLSGTTDYLVAGHIARHAVIWAKTTEKNPPSLFLVDMADPRVRKSAPVASIGTRGCAAIDVVFKGGYANILGKEGGAVEYARKAAPGIHVAAAAVSLGIMRSSFIAANSYAKKRRQGGRRIIEWSEVRMILSRMAQQVEIAKMAVFQAARAVDQRERNFRKIAVATASWVQAAACRVTEDGIQILGGAGYMEDSGQEKRFRDAKQIQAFLGAAPQKILSCLAS